ncbi:DUF1350 family protein [Synechococcus sp. PCC 7336]|uniref:DUF1350 family protein n=1 Tax=Synechococcus sp. PCC 7336 TaxID=195250 RepID=UPI00034AB4DB|nr:DUF1350 family protein [Synechococcus sp. PCC 7336]
MQSEIIFKPLKFDWVAIHPEPIGVVQFIGGAFFGTFPTIFYRDLLGSIFSQGYTIVAKPYRFTFRHWSVAIDLLDSQADLFKSILLEAESLGYSGLHLYQNYINAIKDPEIILEKGKYFWLGHSLGCKYIALLELLSILESVDPEDANLRSDIGAAVKKYGNVNLNDIASLTNQSMILLAPVLADLRNAIPIPALANLFAKFGLEVIPSEKETKDLVVAAARNNGGRFNLVNITGFEGDVRAKDTLDWSSQFRNRFVGGFDPTLSVRYIPLGPHLSPMGAKNIDSRTVDAVKDALSKLS